MRVAQSRRARSASIRLSASTLAAALPACFPLPFEPPHPYGRHRLPLHYTIEARLQNRTRAHDRAWQPGGARTVGLMVSVAQPAIKRSTANRVDLRFDRRFGSGSCCCNQPAVGRRHTANVAVGVFQLTLLCNLLPCLPAVRSLTHRALLLTKKAGPPVWWLQEVPIFAASVFITKQR
jgi:hypothetical protein